MRYKISAKNEKEWQGKKFVEADLVSPTGEAFKVSAWAGEFDGVDEIETELEKNEKGYWKMKKAQIQRPSFMKDKTETITKAMDAKKENIQEAQDRSAWMWAKNNATTLYGDSMKEWLNPQDIADKIIELATKIYHGKPTDPF